MQSTLACISRAFGLCLTGETPFDVLVPGGFLAFGGDFPESPEPGRGIVGD